MVRKSPKAAIVEPIFCNFCKIGTSNKDVCGHCGRKRTKEGK